MKYESKAPQDNQQDIFSYACCPKCSKTLIQAVAVYKGIIKCETCHRRYSIEIKDGKVTKAKTYRT
jgi:DNA-directed RNA polymerase subunit M/transcription elongation factor TFIIS